MRKRIGVAVAIGALALSASAGAAQKQRVVVERFIDTYADVVDCSEFGPYDFMNEFSGRQKVTVTDVLDGDGELLQTVLHIVLQETDTNSETGGTLPLKGAVHEVWDYAANTRTMSGKVYLGTTQGGTYVHETGLIKMTLDEHEAFFVAGPHPAFFEGGIDPAVCAALAEV